jgi:hypothetical protein
MILWWVHVSQKDSQGATDSLHTQQVVSVGWYIDLVNYGVAQRRQRLLGQLHRGFRLEYLLALRGYLIQLDPELKAQLVEFLV